MKKLTKINLIAALVMLIAAMMVPAWSYFTTYAHAKGGWPLSFGEQTRIHEDFENWTKKLSVQNLDKDHEVFVRAIAFAGDYTKLSYEGTGWTRNADGYWYYDKVLGVNGTDADTTEILNVKIEQPKSAEIGDSFNVIIVYESVPAKYNADGTAYADWTQPINKITEEGGN